MAQGFAIGNIAILGSVSGSNSTATPLAAGASFTGAWEDVTQYASISMVCVSDKSGALYAEFSSDSTNVDYTKWLGDPTDDLNLSPIAPQAKWFRVRYDNGSIPQGTFRLQSVFNVNAKVTLPISPDDNYSLQVAMAGSSSTPAGEIKTLDIETREIMEEVRDTLKKIEFHLKTITENEI